jgi:hypothetical protein
MKTGKKAPISIFGVFILATILFSQGSGYLSQKLMVENNIRDRVKDALSKIIDSHKYVINVDVELEVLDEVNEQITVFSPREMNKNKDVESPEQKNSKCSATNARKCIERRTRGSKRVVFNWASYSRF